jgi:hypothetical protein
VVAFVIFLYMKIVLYKTSLLAFNRFHFFGGGVTIEAKLNKREASVVAAAAQRKSGNKNK